MKYNYYQLYGLVIKTAANIPHLISTEAKGITDITINFQKKITKKTYDSQNQLTELYTSYGLAPNGIPYLSVWKQFESEDDFLVIRYTNGKITTFFVSDKKGAKLKVFHHPAMPLNDIYTYLIGPVVGCILRLKIKICLHASVVNINNNAVAFIGEKTAGKSTLIATLAAKGYPVLSDDIAVLSQAGNQFFVHTGYPRLRLWRMSLTQFSNINIENLNPVLSEANKYYVPLSTQKEKQWNFQIHPLPLKTIIYLNPRNKTQHLALNTYEPLAGFLQLKKNIYAEYMLEQSLSIKEFNILGKVVQQIPILSLERPDDLSYMGATCNLITKWIRSNN